MITFTVSYHPHAMQIKRRILNFLCCKACAGDHLGSSMRHNWWMAGKLQTFFFDVGETGLAGGATDGTNVWFRREICISFCADEVLVRYKCTGSPPHLHICNLGARAVWTWHYCPHSVIFKHPFWKGGFLLLDASLAVNKWLTLIMCQ